MAIAGVTDQYCSLFTELEREKWQLYTDISSYNEFGHGFLPYAETGAVVLQDVFAAMSAAVKGHTYAPRSVLHIGHRQTMMTLAATLVGFSSRLGYGVHMADSVRDCTKSREE